MDQIQVRVAATATVFQVLHLVLNDLTETVAFITKPPTTTGAHRRDGGSGGGGGGLLHPNARSDVNVVQWFSTSGVVHDP